jgi:integrase
MTVKKPNHLLKRGNSYHGRRRVPNDLQSVYKKRELKESLGTSDRKTAIRLIAQWTVKTDQEFEAKRRELAGTLQPVAENRPAPATKDLEGLVTNWFHREDRERELAEAIQSPLPDPDRNEVLQTLREDVAFNEDKSNPALEAAIQAQASRLLNARGLSLEASDDRFWILCQLIWRAFRELDTRSLSRFEGDFSIEAADNLFRPSTRSQSQTHSSRLEHDSSSPTVTLDKLIQRFESDPSRAHVRDKSRQAYKGIFRVARDVLGSDTPVDEITRENCRVLRDILLKLPRNATQHFPNLTVQEIVETPASKDLPTLTNNTVKNYLQNLSALFSYASNEELISGRNPAKKLTVRSANEESQRDLRDPFALDQLETIFCAPLYTGCRDDQHGYAKPGQNKPRRGRFWVPLIALWTGMRLNECCQLSVDDVLQENGIWLIRVSDTQEDQRLKTPAASRTIPVHDELLRIGFSEFVVDRQKSSERRLFEELPMGGNGTYSDPFQKWFSRFLKSVDAYTRKTTFHSFRHNFRDALRAAEVSEEIANALGGWKTNEGMSAIYGSGHKPAQLANAINKIEYPSLDLSHLHT